MTGAVQDGPAAPAHSDPDVEREIVEGEAWARAIVRDNIRATLPDHLDVDDELNVVPADGFQPCPLCRGLTVVPLEAAQAPWTMTCPSCDGWGKVQTGSRLKETLTITCRDCNGDGFVDRDVWISTHPEAAPNYTGGGSA